MQAARVLTCSVSSPSPDKQVPPPDVLDGVLHLQRPRGRGVSAAVTTGSMGPITPPTTHLDASPATARASSSSCCEGGGVAARPWLKVSSSSITGGGERGLPNTAGRRCIAALPFPAFISWPIAAWKMSRARCPAPPCASWVLRLQGHALQIGTGRHSSLRMQAGGMFSPPLGRGAFHHGQAGQAADNLCVALHQLPASVAVEEIDLLVEDIDLLVEDSDLLTLAPAGGGREVPAAAVARRWRPRAWTAAEAGAQQGWGRGPPPRLQGRPSRPGTAGAKRASESRQGRRASESRQGRSAHSGIFSESVCRLQIHSQMGFTHRPEG